uniref:Uncharacterized protein n=1 Tax=Siphoviridae sp. ctwQT14 TaxID=2827971 RepID=A0A8S5TKM4_9CAUD|nr:MAG TPA: hypothetical protein [Siphoviridae sp. ctwQT14]
MILLICNSFTFNIFRVMNCLVKRKYRFRK